MGVRRYYFAGLASAATLPGIHFWSQFKMLVLTFQSAGGGFDTLHKPTTTRHALTQKPQGKRKGGGQGTHGAGVLQANVRKNGIDLEPAGDEGTGQRWVEETCQQPMPQLGIYRRREIYQVLPDMGPGSLRLPYIPAALLGHMRGSSTNATFVSSERVADQGQAFSIVDPPLWNSLPVEL